MWTGNIITVYFSLVRPLAQIWPWADGIISKHYSISMSLSLSLTTSSIEGFLQCIYMLLYKIVHAVHGCSFVHNLQSSHMLWVIILILEQLPGSSTLWQDGRYLPPNHFQLDSGCHAQVPVHASKCMPESLLSLCVEGDYLWLVAELHSLPASDKIVGSVAKKKKGGRKGMPDVARGLASPRVSRQILTYVA